MTRIIEHRQDAAPDEQLLELRVFQLRDGDVRGCVVPADLAADLDMMADMSEPVAQAYLNALALCETERCDLMGSRSARPLSATRSTGAATVMRIGPRSLGGIDCERFDRTGSYRRDGLVARFGPTWPARSARRLGVVRASKGLLEAMRRAVYGSDRAILDGLGYVLVNYRRENSECNYGCGCGFDQ